MELALRPQQLTIALASSSTRDPRLLSLTLDATIRQYPVSLQQTPTVIHLVLKECTVNKTVTVLIRDLTMELTIALITLITKNLNSSNIGIDLRLTRVILQTSEIHTPLTNGLMIEQGQLAREKQ
jgi:hypothetical protein